MTRVLVVEDEYLVKALVVDELRDAGFEVLEADNGDEAVRMLREQGPFDLVFTDIRMPGSADGWEVGAEAWRLNAEVKVLYCTGYSGDFRPLKPWERLLEKPYRMATMIGLVCDLVAKGPKTTC